MKGGSLTLDGSGSSDPDGNPLTYAWDLDNDGTYETPGITATFTRPNNGSFTVGLRVSDGALVATDTAVVTVTNVAPAVDAGPDTTIIEGGTFTSSGSFTDPGTDTWTATVTVSDSDGGTGSDTAVVTVKALSTVALTSSLNPSVVGQPVSFTATVSPSAATGTVTFKEGATTLGTATLSGGSTAFSTAVLTSGTHSITAVYEGDGSYLGSVSSPVSQVIAPLVVIDGTTQYFSQLQPAYEAAGNGATIKAQGVTFSENLLLNTAGKNVTIKGGYTSDFTIQSGYSTIKGNLTIGKGGLVADRLIIR